MWKRWLKVLIWFCIFALLLLSFGRSIWMSRQARQEVAREAQEVEDLKQEVENLDRSVQEATSSYELERQVREDLHLQRPDEVIIKLPQDQL